MEFSRQEYWSGYPFPSPGDLPNPGTEPRSPTFRQVLYHLSQQGSPWLSEGLSLTCKDEAPMPANLYSLPSPAMTVSKQAELHSVSLPVNRSGVSIPSVLPFLINKGGSRKPHLKLRCYYHCSEGLPLILWTNLTTFFYF